ncbi:DDE superfamily endonuclease [Carpediemonas membranifera]|uniref:DDE superfamily endonuclease n=1 Tax=Carpediemonas membranifera TaxID=201153 RepID=A0A8J6E0T6_9EUKA|nr:DDE superfamily endonuclease [Carpediemonas membranifera]|eukprot:KAG9389767.1 DDE superfamily endonuclease [Carpediemonas membranifera]
MKKVVIQKVMAGNGVAISAKTIYRIIRDHEASVNGNKTSTEPNKRISKRARNHRQLVTLVRRKLDLDEPFHAKTLAEELATVSHEHMSGETIRRELKNMGLSYKVGDKQFQESDDQRVRDYWAYYATYIRPNHSIKDIMFLDESSFDSHEVRGKSWLPKGRHVVKVSGKTYGKRMSVCALLGIEGMVCRTFTTGTYKADDFFSSLERFCEVIKDKNRVLVLDNARSHKNTDKELWARLANTYNIDFVFLPGYSPQLNPIERVFGIVKANIARYKPKGERHTAHVIRAMDEAHKSIDIPALYRSCGYY